MSGIIGISPNTKSGVIGRSPIGQTCRMYVTSAIASADVGYFTDWTLDYNQDATIFTPVVAGSPQGLMCNVSGMYLFVRSFYHTSQGDTGYVQNYLSKNATNTINNSYQIYTNYHAGSYWTKDIWPYTMTVAAGEVMGLYYNVQNNYIGINGGINSTWIMGTFLGEVPGAVTIT